MNTNIPLGKHKVGTGTHRDHDGQDSRVLKFKLVVELD